MNLFDLIIKLSSMYRTEADSQSWRTDFVFATREEDRVGWTGSLGITDASHYIQNG